MAELPFGRVRVKIVYVDLEKQFYRLETNTIDDPMGYGFRKYYIWYRRDSLCAQLSNYNLSPIDLRGYTIDVLPSFRNPKAKLHLFPDIAISPFVNSIVQVH